MIPFCPAIRREYDADLNLTLPLRPWGLRSGGLGGADISATGVPESYEIRRDRVATVTLRAYEGAELDALMFILEEIRASSESFTFAFDQQDPDTDYVVYLHAPTWPEELVPARDEATFGVFTLEVQLRTVDGTPFLHTFLEEE